MNRIILLVPLLISLTACVSPRAAAPTVAHQRAAIDALAAAYANDLALLRANTETLLDIHRTTTLGSLHRELIEHALISPAGDADTTALDTALADPASTATLVLEVRAGRMTQSQAHRFLADYALLAKHSDAHSLQQQALATLLPAQQLAAAAVSIHAALDEHTQDMASLVTELSDSNIALAAFASSSALPDSLSAPSARALWHHLITNTITDPAQRTAALDLLDNILAH